MKKLFMVIAAALLLVSPASALTESQKDQYDLSGVYYYNPDSSSCTDYYGNYDGIPTAGLTPLQSAFIDKYYNIAVSLGQEYGIPWEAVMAQGIIESASGTSRFAVERNNFFGLGAVDSNPNNAYSYSSPSAGWRGYFEFIKNNPRYAAAGAFNHANDPLGYIQAIKNAGYATDPNYVAKVGQYIKAIQDRADEKGWVTSGSSDYATGITSYVGTDTCTSATQGNGDINATALALSWPDRSHAPDDPKSEYVAALAATGVNRLGDQYSMTGRSCDAFVATVLRYSGADPNVPCCGVTRMLSYFSTHSDLYEEVPNTGSTANLQPGDIRIDNEHVEIVVQVGGTYKIASASHPAHDGSDNGRTADHYNNYYVKSSYRIFRKK